MSWAVGKSVGPLGEIWSKSKETAHAARERFGLPGGCSAMLLSEGGQEHAGSVLMLQEGQVGSSAKESCEQKRCVVRKHVTWKARGLSQPFPTLPPAKELQFYSFTRLHFCGLNWTNSVGGD